MGPDGLFLFQKIGIRKYSGGVNRNLLVCQGRFQIKGINQGMGLPDH
jgi:hypothetical protein